MPNKASAASQMILDARQDPDGVWRVHGTSFFKNGLWIGVYTGDSDFEWDLGDVTWTPVRVGNVRAFYTDENGNTKEIYIGNIGDGGFHIS